MSFGESTPFKVYFVVISFTCTVVVLQVLTKVRGQTFDSYLSSNGTWYLYVTYGRDLVVSVWSL